MEKKVIIKPSILDRPIIRPKTEVSLSAFAFLFSEVVQYNQNRVSSVSDLEKKLDQVGFSIGQRVIELVWKHLFNKVADNLERSTENEDEYMIHELTPITNSFISVPSDLGHLNCASFLAGIIGGVLESSKFHAKVTAHFVSNGDGSVDRTVFLIKFTPEVMSRERKLS